MKKAPMVELVDTMDLKSISSSKSESSSLSRGTNKRATMDTKELYYIFVKCVEKDYPYASHPNWPNLQAKERTFWRRFNRELSRQRVSLTGKGNAKANSRTTC